MVVARKKNMPEQDIEIVTDAINYICSCKTGKAQENLDWMDLILNRLEC